MTGFWGLNAGLMGIIRMTLVPVDAAQAIASFEKGYWWTRSYEFYAQPYINQLLWLRMIPDTVFIVVGILPIAGAARNRKAAQDRARRSPIAAWEESGRDPGCREDTET